MKCLHRPRRKPLTTDLAAPTPRAVVEDGHGERRERESERVRGVGRHWYTRYTHSLSRDGEEN